MREELARTEWATKHICLFIGRQAQVDLKAHGGRNPLVDDALEMSIFPQPRSQEDEELDELRGEYTGHVTHEEGQRLMRESTMAAKVERIRERPHRPRPRKPEPKPDTAEVDEDGNFIGYALGEQKVEEAAPGGGPSNGPGSFEAFMQMFGGGGQPAPRGPIPE
jgi:hypothetical protein